MLALCNLRSQAIPLPTHNGVLEPIAIDSRGVASDPAVDAFNRFREAKNGAADGREAEFSTASCNSAQRVAIQPTAFSRA